MLFPIWHGGTVKTSIYYERTQWLWQTRFLHVDTLTFLFPPRRNQSWTSPWSLMGSGDITDSVYLWLGIFTHHVQYFVFLALNVSFWEGIKQHWCTPGNCPMAFPLQSLPFQYNSSLCQLQRFSDDPPLLNEGNWWWIQEMRLTH